MPVAVMHLKVLLPFQVFAEKTEGSRIVAETREGSFGLPYLSRRVSCKPRAALFIGPFAPTSHPTATAGASAVTGKLTAKHVFRGAIIDRKVVTTLYVSCRPRLHRSSVNDEIGLATVQEQPAEPRVVHMQGWRNLDRVQR
jgi:hypothetical protein